MKNVVSDDVALCGLARSNILEEHVASIFRAERITEFRTFPVTNNLVTTTVTADILPGSQILSTLNM
jgi:hypothetical protein